MLAALPGSGTGILDGFLQINAGHAEAGKKAEADGGRDGDEDGPEKRCYINVQRGEKRQCDGALMRKPEEQRACEQEAYDGSGGREHEALCEELANDARAACAES